MVREGRHSLDMEYKWYSGKAWLLGGMAVFWNSLLLIIGGGMVASGTFAPLLFLSFHALAGFFLGYSALANFMNKSKLKIKDGQLKIEHGPIPWRGNKLLKAADIEQVYVTQKVHKSDKGATSYSYQVRANVAGKRGVKLLNIQNIRQPEDARVIERHIEDHLGIEDQKVIGEFRASDKPKLPDRARKSLEAADPTDMRLKDLSPGAVLDYQAESWEILYQTQYDWRNGSTDRQLQLKNSEGNTILLFLKQDLAVWHPWIEKRFVASAAISQTILRSGNNFPPSFEIEGENYFLQEKLSGKIFRGSTRGSIDGRQLMYVNGSQNKSLRIIISERQDAEIFVGSLEDDDSFSDIYSRI